MTGHVIDFKPDGTVEAMHNDKLDLSFLGKQKIKRATDIVFNEFTQSWSIRVPNATGLFVPIIHADPTEDTGYVQSAMGFHTYDHARSVEVAWLNSCRLADVEPTSPEGLKLLTQAREASGV